MGVTILSVCGTLAQCDPDGDGFVTPKDFNNPQFSEVPAPDSDGNGRITCKDLIAAGSPYVDGVDSDMNGFVDDLCGWNFVTLSNDVIAPSCRDDPDGLWLIPGNRAITMTNLP